MLKSNRYTAGLMPCSLTIENALSEVPRCLYLILAVCLGLSLTSCGKQEEEPKRTSPATIISTVKAETTTLEIREEAVGTIEGLVDPTVAAEVSARVVKVLVHPGQKVNRGDPVVLLDPTDFSLQRREAEAEVARIQALLDNQQRVVERNRALVEKKFISQNALEDTTTQAAALKQQLAGARSRLASIEHTGSKARVLSPLYGTVEKQIVSPGDFVNVGDPLIQIISNQRLRAHLPFPESIAAKLQPGLKVRLSTPTSPDQVTSTIRELKPLIGETNRSVDVIADIVNQPGWQSGASVNGTVILGERPEAVVVPEQSIVLRPAGEVVYVIKEGVAHQRKIKTGVRQAGMVEIVEGLQGGELVAVDGAAFLTDQAKVTVQEAPPAEPQGQQDVSTNSNKS
ncbi:MAG TPA: efflux RND transporter periplasmic adaptor subunit [Methylophilaceae bacterium]|nr:efflux RND transporter periplasmic adaptor subunit [Methylophilaceae bacterium]